MRFVFIDEAGREIEISSHRNAAAAIRSGRLRPETLVRPAGEIRWRPAAEALPDILDPATMRELAAMSTQGGPAPPRWQVGRGRGPFRRRGAVIQGGPRAQRLIGRIFMAIGIVLIIAGGIVAVMRVSWLAGAATAVGVVVDLDRQLGDEGWRPVIEFETEAGDRITWRSPVATNPPAYALGEQVTVHYDPALPSDATVAGLLGWFFALVPGGIGLVFLVIGTGLAIAGRRRGPREPAEGSVIERQ